MSSEAHRAPSRIPLKIGFPMDPQRMDAFIVEQPTDYAAAPPDATAVSLRECVRLQRELRELATKPSSQGTFRRLVQAVSSTLRLATCQVWYSRGDSDEVLLAAAAAPAIRAAELRELAAPLIDAWRSARALNARVPEQVILADDGSPMKTRIGIPVRGPAGAGLLIACASTPVHDMQQLSLHFAGSAIEQLLRRAALDTRITGWNEDHEHDAVTRRARVVAETGLDLVTQHDLDGNILFASSASTALLGYAPEELVGRWGYDLVHADDLADVRRSHTALRNSGVSQRFTCRLRDRNGGFVWVDCACYLLESDNSETPAEIMVVSRDLTEPLGQQCERSAQHALFRSLLERNHVGVLSLDHDAVVQYANPAIVELLGLEDPAELVGEALTRWIAFGAREDFECAWDELRGGVPTSLQCTFQACDDEAHEVLLSSAPLNIPTEQFAGAVITVIDITERRMHERRRREFEDRLQHGSHLESLGRLAAAIAHDFNNLLTGVLGYATVALREVADNRSPEAALRNIVQTTNRAIRRTAQIQVYTGSATYDIANTDINGLVRTTVRSFARTLDQSQHCTMDLIAGSARADVDEQQVRHALRHVLQNAHEALVSTGGLITVSTALEDLSVRQVNQEFPGQKVAPGTFLRVRVVDNGMGMTPQTLQRAFDPFFSTKFVGRGLGLAAARGIMTAHRGAVRIQSAAGTGTTVDFLIPQRSASMPRPEPPRETASGTLAGKTVLVVDDEPEVRDIARLALEDADMRVLTAVDGAAGIRVLRAHRSEIDIVLLDMTMPVMCGDEVLRILRLEAPDLPVVVTSGFSAQEATERLAGDSPTAFLQKPFNLEELVNAIRRYIDTPVR